METKKKMIGLFCLNILFYAVDLLVIYKQYIDNPARYYVMLNLKIFYTFLFSLVLMIPTVGAYFILFNYLKERGVDEKTGDMLIITAVSLAFLFLAAFYSTQA